LSSTCSLVATVAASTLGNVRRHLKSGEQPAGNLREFMEKKSRKGGLVRENVDEGVNFGHRDVILATLPSIAPRPTSATLS